MNIRIVAVAALCAVVTGCAGVTESMRFNDVKHVTFSDPSLPIGFWIFDHPSEGKMLINQDPGSAAGAGMAKGLTLGIVDTSTPPQVFRKGAQAWLTAQGRDCTVTGVDRIIAPTNYEASYVCKP